MSAGFTPEDGDIVIRPERREDELVYLLRAVPRPEQYLLRSREEAVGQALRFAKREHVRAWLADEGQDVVLLEDFRVMKTI